MLRGVELNVKTQANALLNAILRHDSFSQMVAVCTQYEVIVDENDYTIPSPTTADNLAKILEGKDPLIIFLNLKLLPKWEQRENVSNYKEFLYSSYSLVCLITDVRCVEIYVKDAAVLDEILKIAQQLKISDIKLKDESDGRNSFSIM